MTTCPSCGQQSPDGFRFCGACGTALPTDDAGGETRKTVTVVFCDLVGSTQLGESLDPEVLRRLLEQFFAAMRDVLERHGGSVAKFSGDAVLAVFGIPQLREDDALRAVRAALEMRERLLELNQDVVRARGVTLEARWGVNTGSVLVPEGGGDHGLVVGDAVNTAARLEAAAAPGTIVVGESTYRLVGHALTAEPLGALELKGKLVATPAWRVLAVNPDAEIASRQLTRPLIGRLRELGALQGAFQRTVEDGRCGLVTVLGFPGMGKSRLAAELVSAVVPDARVLAGRCLSYGEGITYSPIADMLNETVGGDVRGGLEQLLLGQADAGDVVTLVASVLGEGVADGSGEAPFWAIRRLFETLAVSQPLVLIFEDIHWAEPTLLDLIEHLADWVRERPILLLCLARPELLEARPAWGGGKINAISLLLAPLSDVDSRLMLEQGLLDRPLSPEVRDQITKSAQGVPLFLEQMLAMLDERGPIASTDVPPVIQSLLAARIELLDDADRSLLEHAAVEGEQFHAGAVAALGRVEGSLVPQLSELVRRELIRTDEPGLQGELRFRFAHGLIRDAAYERLPKAERAALHERLADWLEAHDAVEELVGYHLERAHLLGAELAPPDERALGIARRASELLATAGRRALHRGDFSATANLLERAVALLPAGSLERLALLPELGSVLGELDVPRADSVLSEAIASARELGDARVEWESIVIRSRVRLYIDPTARPLAEVLSEAERATEELEALDHHSAVADALLLRGDVHWMLGQLSRMSELCERAIGLSRGASSTRAIGYAGSAIMYGPEPATRAERRCRELLAQAAGNRTACATLYESLGWLQAMQGDPGEGRRTARIGWDTLTELGIDEWGASNWLACGYIEALDGKLEEAERYLSRAVEVFRDLGDVWFLSTAVVDHALVLCALGRHSEALRVSDQPRAPYDVEWVIKWNRVQALAALASGDPDRALVHASSAVEAAELTEYIDFHAAALADRATVLDELGRSADGRADLEAALSLHERKENVIESARIRALLRERQ
jgi:class 3 adenylate cyclase/tetratricopeptide (TPR) repeat protein